MSNLLRLPNRRQIAEEAATWVVALQDGLPEEELGRLQQWLKADPAHAEELVRIAGYWDAFDALAELADTFPLARQGDQPAKTFTFKVAAAAAVALVALGVTVTTVYLLKAQDRDALLAPSVTARSVAEAGGEPQGFGKASEFTTRTYHTTVGRQLTASLPDGSMVMLNTDTSLDITYSAARRLVTLNKGEAIFRVAHNPSRPFQVQVGARIVQAVGTVFNVMHLVDDDLRVTVSEGTVKVLAHEPPQPQGVHAAAAHPELLVRAGEQAFIDTSGVQVQRMEESSIAAKDAWQRGLLVYNGETLDAVIADVSRYTTVRFLISDDSIRGKRVGGMFRAGDVDGLLLALRESFGIDARREGNVVVLTARQ